MSQKLLRSFVTFLLTGIVVAIPVFAQQGGYIDTSLEVCNEKITEIPPGFDVDPAEVSSMLHGVWLGSRKSWAENVPQDPADYVMIIDVENRESMTYEFSGQGVTENRFREEFPPPAQGAPELTYFYCGGPLWGPFRDRFVKVSDQPTDGLQALSSVTGIPTDGESIFDVLVAFRKAGYYEDRGATRVNAAFYTMALTPTEGTGGRARNNIRLDLVGQLIAASGQNDDGQPRAGHEGGYFHGIQAAEGRYLASFAVDAYISPELATSVGERGGVYVLCNGLANDSVDNLFSIDEDPLHEFVYTKVVFGPMH